MDIVDLAHAMEELDRQYTKALADQRRANDLLVAAHRKIRELSDERRILSASKRAEQRPEPSAQPAFA